MKWLDIHDPILRDLHSLGLSDTQIRDRMLIMGHGFSIATVASHRALLKLPGNLRKGWEPPPPAEAPNPIYMAQMTLGSRLVEKSTGYYLDGVPTCLDHFMQAANRARANNGLTQIPGSPKWRIDTPPAPPRLHAQSQRSQ
jgi:hypothetical protein